LGKRIAAILKNPEKFREAMQQMRKHNLTECQPGDTSSPFTRCHYLAHELASPLGGMLMSVDIIEKYFAVNPHAHEEIGDLPQILKAEIKRLIELLEQFRSAQIPNAGDLQPISLGAEVREILALQSAYYERHRVRIQQELALDLPCILADASHLRQVVLNLCNNAVEAMPDGGTLTIRSYARAGWLCLDIEDTGNGIPAGMKIFRPGVTDKSQSSGLGLAIVRDLVERHHGTISYTTKAAQGTTFYLKFPIEGPNVSATPAQPGAATVGAIKDARHSIRQAP
jgi:signal transduction histidine kinase